MIAQGQNATAMPERQRYVEQELNRLSAALAGLEASSDGLIDRIGSVLRAEPAQPGANVKGVNESLCPLADQLSHLANAAGAIMDRLNNVRGRLEL